jgi:single-stranded DNA-binding protein
MLNAVVVGYVTRQPEFKQSAKGTNYLKFQVEVPAPQGRYPKKVSVTMFGNYIQTVGNSLAVGHLVSLQGEPQASAYTDKQGKPKGALDLIARECNILSGNTAPSQPVNNNTNPNAFNPPFTEGDIPF